MEKDAQYAFDTREIRACREWQAVPVAAGFSRRRARRERDVGAKEDVSCIEVQWIGYSIFSALGRPEDQRWFARAPARPTGRSDKSGLLAESVTSTGFLSDVSTPSA